MFCEHTWDDVVCSICKATQEQVLGNYRIPDKVEVLMNIGRRMRGLGENLAEIERLHDSYYVHVKITAITKKGGGPAITAGEILMGHMTAAANAEKILREGHDKRGITNQLIAQHVSQQDKFCSCGKRGFRDFSYGAISNSGLATIEYKCILCKKGETFTVDHSC